MAKPTNGRFDRPTCISKSGAQKTSKKKKCLVVRKGKTPLDLNDYNNIACDDIIVSKLRTLIPKYCHYIYGSSGTIDVWSKWPPGWPGHIPFRDPNNCNKSMAECGICRRKKFYVKFCDEQSRHVCEDCYLVLQSPNLSVNLTVKPTVVNGTMDNGTTGESAVVNGTMENGTMDNGTTADKKPDKTILWKMFEYLRYLYQCKSAQRSHNEMECFVKLMSEMIMSCDKVSDSQSGAERLVMHLSSGSSGCHRDLYEKIYEAYCHKNCHMNNSNEAVSAFAPTTSANTLVVVRNHVASKRAELLPRSVILPSPPSQMIDMHPEVVCKQCDESSIANTPIVAPGCKHEAAGVNCDTDEQGFSLSARSSTPSEDSSTHSVNTNDLGIKLKPDTQIPALLGAYAVREREGNTEATPLLVTEESINICGILQQGETCCRCRRALSVNAVFCEKCNEELDDIVLYCLSTECNNTSGGTPEINSTSVMETTDSADEIDLGLINDCTLSVPFQQTVTTTTYNKAQESQVSDAFSFASSNEIDDPGICHLSKFLHGNSTQMSTTHIPLPVVDQIVSDDEDDNMQVG